MPVELRLDGVLWDLASGEVRIPLHGDDDAIARFLARLQEMASAPTSVPNVDWLRFATDPGELVVTGVTAETRFFVEPLVKDAAASAP